MIAAGFDRPAVDRRLPGWWPGRGEAWLLGLAALCWAGLVLLTLIPGGHGHHASMMVMPGGPAPTHSLPSPGGFAACWLLMLGAMMLPLTLPLVEHVKARSFRERRMRSASLLLSGYATVWSLAGGVVYAASLSFVAGDIPTAGPLALLAAAACWQVLPVRSRLFRRCRAGVNLAPTGLRADRDCFRAGMRAGLRCAITCLPMMAAVMVGSMQLPGMLAVAAAMMVEQDRAAPLRLRETVVLVAVLAACTLW